MTRSQCKVYAIRFLRGESIPVFKDKIVNQVIDAFVRQIRHLRTRKRKQA